MSSLISPTRSTRASAICWKPRTLGLGPAPCAPTLRGSTPLNVKFCSTRTHQGCRGRTSVRSTGCRARRPIVDSLMRRSCRQISSTRSWRTSTRTSRSRQVWRRRPSEFGERQAGGHGAVAGRSIVRWALMRQWLLRPDPECREPAAGTHPRAICVNHCRERSALGRGGRSTRRGSGCRAAPAKVGPLCGHRGSNYGLPCEV